MQVPDTSSLARVGKGAQRPDNETLIEGIRHIHYFLQFIRPNWSLFNGVVGLSLVTIILQLPIMYLPAILTSHFQPSDGTVATTELGWPIQGLVGTLRTAFGSPGYLSAVVTVAFTGTLLLCPLQLLRSYLCGLLGANFLLRLRMALFGNLKNLSMLAVYERGAGSFVQRLTRDLLLAYEFFAHTLTGLVSLVMYVVISLIALLLLEWKLTLILLAVYALVQPVLMLFNRRIQRQSTLLQELHEQLTTHMLESVGGYRDIIATGQFERMTSRFRDQAERLRREGLRSLLWSQSAELLLGLVFGLLTVVPYFLILRRLDNVQQVGHFITYVGFLSSFLPSLAGLWGTSIELALVTPSLRAIREMLEAANQPPPRRSPGVAPPAPPETVHSIRFDGVGLKIGDRWILRDLTFEIAGGQMTAIIGQSGSGKTTIFHLLLRLLVPTCGTIWINDHPLADFDEDDLRRMIGFIPQNPFIFNSSLRENILVASFDADRAEAILNEVVCAAQLEELVRSRAAEGGLNAGAGYLGMQLSAGERQRIALARILVQNPAVVVCDEYTANIDVVTATLIQKMMQTRWSDRTRVVITHELYNTRGAEQILVLDGGRIIQSGTHAALIAETGLYRTMWEAQRIE